MSNDNKSLNNSTEQQQKVSSKVHKIPPRNQDKKSQKSSMKLNESDNVTPKDEFYISPILLLGGFILALGVGFLLPGSGGFNGPAYQTWSIIFAGVVVCIPGIYQQLTHKKNQ